MLNKQDYRSFRDIGVRSVESVHKAKYRLGLLTETI